MAKQLEQISDNDDLWNFNPEANEDLMHSVKILLESVKENL